MRVDADPKVLVVGTTTDYVDWIRKACPGAAVFVTDPRFREKAPEPPPEPWEEVLSDPCDFPLTLETLRTHLGKHGFTPEGLACFDCESMGLAAFLAEAFQLDYPSGQAVLNCRSKLLSKSLWRRHGLDTPRGKLVASGAEAVRFMEEIDGPCVLKPLSGSGSELVFLCGKPESAMEAFRKIRGGLAKRRSGRLYGPFAGGGGDILAEERIQGLEYSCDALIQNGEARILRLTRKVPAPRGPFGTTLGYALTTVDGVAVPRTLARTISRGAGAVGIHRAVCMTDFIVDGDRVVLLETAPRPGGDCIPFLLRRAWGLDILKLTLDFSRSGTVPPVPAPTTRCAGLRLLARGKGVIRNIDAATLEADERVLEVKVTRRPGHRVTLPPEDYDSWILGHAVFRPGPGLGVRAQCEELAARLVVEME